MTRKNSNNHQRRFDAALRLSPFRLNILEASADVGDDDATGDDATDSSVDGSPEDDDVAVEWLRTPRVLVDADRKVLE